MMGPLAIKLPVAALALAAALAAGGCDRGPSCREAAARMVEVANADAPAGEEVTDPDAAGRLERACRDEDWPAEIRRCLAGAADQEAATACMRQLGRPGES